MHDLHSCKVLILFLVVVVCVLFSYCCVLFLVFEGRPRNKQTIEATAGAVTGEATFEGDDADDEDDNEYDECLP